jgi:signal transduction histidine kinase
LATPKGIRIDIDADGQEAWVGMSEEDLLTVLSNLIENAIQYSDPGKPITIGIRTDNGRCEISVSDAGCGIAQSALPYIFDRFYRGDASRARATGGVGLGLSIVKALMVRAHGTISVKSELGKGATFSVVIPTL